MKDDHRDGRNACLQVEPLLATFAAGALDEEGERRVRDHLAVCPSCRSAQVERDPSVLFLELRRAPLPDGFWEGFNAELRRRIESGSRWRIPFLGDIVSLPARRLAYVAAPLVMVLLLGTLILMRPGGPGHRRTGSRAPGPAAVLPEPPAAAGPGAPPVLEEVGSPGARIYRFTVGEAGGETPIYFVVDESIDI